MTFINNESIILHVSYHSLWHQYNRYHLLHGR
ncbi:hypothetical protein ACV56Z_05570 [Staphylococcus aureus]